MGRYDKYEYQHPDLNWTTSHEKEWLDTQAGKQRRLRGYLEALDWRVTGFMGNDFSITDRYEIREYVRWLLTGNNSRIIDGDGRKPIGNGQA